MKSNKAKIGFTAISAVSLFGAVAVFLRGPIPQDVQYHLFGDTRSIFNIPNFWNVFSNLPFLMAGAMGIHGMFISRNLKISTEMQPAHFIFFLGVFLVGLGSGYYHLSPNNHTLLWDRLPMSIAFTALISIIIGEFISIRSGRLSLFILPALGVFSVFYWYATETVGTGDLRPYILVQFLPILILPIILICFKSCYTLTIGYWLLFRAYVVAKGFEYFDTTIYNFGHLLSGHTLKHFAAALGVFLLIKTYQNRQAN